MDIDHHHHHHHDQKHCCKVCAKCFPCGRSLGGHMRSHLLPSSSSFDPDDKPSPPPPLPPHCNTKSKSYVLRDNPKKSCRLPSSSSTSSIEECFNPCYYYSSEQEEDVALILMMLSRDTASSSSSWLSGFNHESSDKNSIVFEDNARDYDVSDNEYNSLTHTKKRKSRYRYRYQCRACGKCFDTYQALGGHRASHKRSDKGSKKIIESVEYPALKKVKKQHQCSICLKVFSSGQALGGHKRSHIAAAAAIATTNTDTAIEVVVHHQKELESSPLMSELLDLNLPAVVAAATADDDDDDGDAHVDEESNNNSINVNGGESWWNGNLE